MFELIYSNAPLHISLITCGVLCILFSIPLLIRGIRRKHKYEKLNHFKQMAHENLLKAKTDGITDSVIIGAGSAALSAVELCIDFAIHGDVIDTLEYRFPDAVGDNNFIDWINKIGHLEAHPEQLEAYISAYKGQAAEDIALKLLSKPGVHAELFDSLTHKADDIHTSSFSGLHNVDYSVKCGSVDYIKNCIDHSTSDHYVINTESYEVMKSNGLIDYYNHHGIDIIDGHYSDYDLQDSAEHAFSSINDSADVTHSIPIISLAFFGYKTYKNVKSFKDKKQSSREFGINVATDAVGIGIRGVAGYTTGTIGGAIGTFVFPGVGTFIGTAVGTIVGGLGVNKLLSKGKETLKWGYILKAQDFFGQHFSTHMKTLCNCLAEKLFNESTINGITSENQLLINNDFKDQLDIYCNTDVTYEAVLANECVLELKKMQSGITHMKSTLEYRVNRFIKDYVSEIKNNKQREETANRLRGELLLQNRDLLGSLSSEEQLLSKEYDKQRKINYNYPVKYSTPPSDIIEALANEVYVEGIKNTKYKSKQYKDISSMPLVIATFLSILGIALIVL